MLLTRICGLKTLTNSQLSLPVGFEAAATGAEADSADASFIMDPQAGGTSPSQSTTDPVPMADDAKAKDQSPRVQQQSQTVQQTVQALTDRALDFLSTASNETIGACLVGLGAGTYMLLGRVGLVLIGAVGGVVLHATWEGTRGPSDDGKGAAEDRRRKEVGLDVIHRVLKWRSQGQVTETNDDGEMRVDTFGLTERDLDFSDFKPETAEALRGITDAVIRDYVKWWYSPIIPDETTFPYASRLTLTSFILGISNNLSRKRPADAFLNFVTHTSSTVVVFLNELATAINASPNAKAEDAVRAYVELKPNSSLANVLDATQQRKKLALVAEDILQTYLEPKTYNCQPAHTFLRQILANTIIDNTIEKCSEAWWINDWIVYLLEDGEPALAKSVNAGLEGTSGDVKGNIVKEAALIETSDKLPRKGSDVDHRRVVSRGQEAFDDAMQEAARLTKLMQEEDERYAREEAEAQKTKEEEEPRTPVEQEATLAAAGALSGIDAAPIVNRSSTSIDEQSESTTQGMDTPTSSQSEKNGDIDPDSERVMSSESQRSEQQATASTISDAPAAAFTSFDQLAPGMTANSADDENFAPREREPLTLHNANLTIFDDGMPGDKQAIKAKPVAEYLIQIEPASSDHSGWMVAKKYSDIETLHESIRRISVVTGAKFHEVHPTVPKWRGQTKSQLREALERYLNDACQAKSLAESEAMRRFLEKEQGLMKSPGNKGGFNAAFGAMGKGLMGAGKGIEGGGKAIVGGVTGVFGGLAPKRTQSNSSGIPRMSTSSPHNRSESVLSTATKGRQSTDSLRKTISQAQTEGRATPSLESDRRSSLTNSPETVTKPTASSPGPSLLPDQPESVDGRPASIRQEQDEGSTALNGSEEMMQLPPPPSEVTDDYNGHAISSPTSPVKRHKTESIFSTTTTLAEAPEIDGSGYTALASEPELPQPRKAKASKDYQPLNEQETTIVVELLFATITELYTLSSAWSLRRTLLNAAKTYLLRPGNPQLASIRELIQSTVLDANTSDEGIALQLQKLRENSLPTEEEFAAWPKPLTDEEKEALRKKARKLLVTKGMPVALTSVMGQAASGEAMGKIFDCLQVKEVARGLMFGLMLQGIRTVVQ